MSPADPNQPAPPAAAPGPAHEPEPQEEKDTGEDRQLHTAELMVGVGMMFVGFLNVLLSISGGFEINIVPLLLYFAGLAVWAHATIVHPTVRYIVITAAIAFGLAFFHYGEVLFWHKQVVFWGTVAMVVFFMFKTAAPSSK
jgi:hypothetical protein